MIHSTIEDAPDRPHDADIAWVRRYGGPVSHSLLDASCRIFRVEGIPGFIGYSLHHHCAVAMGDPLCSPEHFADITHAFIRFCDEQQWSVIFAVASSDMRNLAGSIGAGILEIADLLIANPQKDPLLGAKGGHLRTSVRFPLRKGVIVREYEGNRSPEPELETRIMAAIHNWRSNRRGFQMHIGSHQVFKNKAGCRWFLAELEGQIVGVLYMMEIGRVGCPFMIDLVLSIPQAPPHTNELLIVSAFRQLMDEGHTAVCLGPAPLAAIGEIAGLGRFSAWLARYFYGIANRLVPQTGKAIFWKKFGISTREPLYLIFMQPHVGLREFRALLKTFNIYR